MGTQILSKLRHATNLAYASGLALMLFPRALHGPASEAQTPTPVRQALPMWGLTFFI